MLIGTLASNLFGQSQQLTLDASSNAKDGAYFCTPLVRGVSDAIFLDTDGKSLQLSGNIKLQSALFDIESDNISVALFSGGFNLLSTAVGEKKLVITIKKEVQKFNDCTAGLEKDQAVPSFTAETDFFEWNQENQTTTATLRGLPLIKLPENNISFTGQTIEFSFINEDELQSIRVLNNFQITYNLQQLTAEQALIDLPNKKITAIGTVSLNVRGRSLLSASRLQVELGENNKINVENLDTSLTIK